MMPKNYYDEPEWSQLDPAIKLQRIEEKLCGCGAVASEAGRPRLSHRSRARLFELRR